MSACVYTCELICISFFHSNELKQQSPKGTCLSATSHLGKPAGAIVPTQQSGSGVYQPPPGKMTSIT